MDYQDIPESPQFNSQIRKIETMDLVHADIMNEFISKLLENDVFLKAFAEGLAAKVLEHTEKKEIHVTATDKTAWNETYQQSTGYTDQKIAELINGAPETLDTLKEIADAMAENNTVVEALDTAIGKKADAAEFETLQKKYYGMVGNNDISSIGDGTLTGAVSSLNTESQNIPALNGLNIKMKVCAGTAYAQFSSREAIIALEENFSMGMPVINFMSSAALLANSHVRNNTLVLYTYPDYANAQIYVKYIVIGY